MLQKIYKNNVLGLIPEKIDLENTNLYEKKLKVNPQRCENKITLKFDKFVKEKRAIKVQPTKKFKELILIN